MILIVIGFGTLFWILQSTIDVFIFHQGNLVENIFTVVPHEIWMRALVLYILIMFALYAQKVIAERRKAEEAIKRSERDYRELFESAHDAIIIINTNGEIVLDVNQRACQIYGFCRSEFIGMSLKDMSKDIPRGDKHVRLTLDKGFCHHFETVQYRKDQTEMFLEINASVVNYKGQQAILSINRDITERKKAKEELERSVSLLGATLESVADGILAVDQDGGIVSFNKKFKEMWRIPERVIASQDEDQILAYVGDQVKDPEGFIAKINRLRSQPDAESCDIIECKDGRVFRRYSQPQHVRGKSVGRVWSFRDITEPKRVEASLRVKDWALRSSINAFALADPEGNLTYVNPSFLKLWEYDDESEVLGRPTVSFWQKEKKAMEVTESIRNKGSWIGTLVAKRKNGSTFDVLLSASIVPDDAGKPICMMASFMDITERKRAEEALRESEEKFRMVAEQSPNMIFINKMGRVIYANKKSEEIMGYKREEFYSPNFNFLNLIYQESKDLIKKNFNRHMKGEEVAPIEYTLVTKEGKRIEAILTTKLIKYEGERAILGTVTEIAEQKRAEEILRKAKDEAEQANQLKSEFLANMSHEIRTPMNAIIGMTDLTLDTELTTEQRDYLSTVKESSHALLELLNDILDLSRIEADRIELDKIDFDLRVTVEGVTDTLAPKACAKGLELACMIHHQVPSLLRGDPGRLRQILLNLVGNGIKFTENGEVVINVELKEETADGVTLLFSVTDTGIGIPKDKHGRIFESFTQANGSTTREYGGTGLGLSISRRLVELMDGQIGLESEPGRGSRFWFTVTFEKSKDLKDPSLPPLPDIRGMRMLVVDDNKSNRIVLVEMLKSFGCWAKGVESGEEALQTLKKEANQREPFHLVLLDMLMPWMNGEETLKAIKKDPEIKDVVVIVLTSVGVRGDASRLEALGCAGYLMKPIKQSQLYDAIITVLGLHKNEEKNKPHPIVTRHTLAEKKRQGTRILLAEDNPMNQKLAVTLLTRAGFSVDAVENGSKAIEALKRTPYDLILMDVQMSEMNGFEATKAIREIEGKKKHIPIIAMTAHAMKGDRERCLQAGMDDYVS